MLSAFVRLAAALRRLSFAKSPGLLAVALAKASGA